MLTLAGKIYNREYDRLRAALGNKPHALVNQLELLRMGHPYYNSRAEGGEGHLEVAKNIYYSNKDLCHMVLSLKPFGCMPSTQSDGAQSAVISHFKDMIYIPIETSGEGDVNAHSRVQMALGEAKVKAKNEFARVLQETGRSLEDIRAYVAAHPEMQRPAWKISHHQGCRRHRGELRETGGSPDGCRREGRQTAEAAESRGHVLRQDRVLRTECTDASLSLPQHVSPQHFSRLTAFF